MSFQNGRGIYKYKISQVRSVIKSRQALLLNHSIRHEFMKCCTKGFAKIGILPV